MGTGDKRLRRVLLGVASAALTLCAVEVALRVAGVCSPVAPIPLRLPGQAAADGFLRPDELLIYAGVPGARTYPWYTIDGHGYRTPPFADRKPPGTLRIVVTGDSTTFGLGVLDDECWASVLRRAVAGLCAGERPSEVIDAGTTGYSTWQNRVQAERDFPPLQPDAVVVMVAGANDATRVEGRGDAEVASSQFTFVRRLARLHLACLCGLNRHGWSELPPNAAPGSPTARPRVRTSEVADNLRAMADALPGRLVLGLFVPQSGYREAEAIHAIAATVEAVAAERGLPVADVRPAIDALLPYPIYADMVHPTALGHVVIARTVLAALLPRLGLSPARTAWCAAWAAACEGGLPKQAAALQEDGAPARFRELRALYREGDVDARLASGDPSLPASVRAWDPLAGERCGALSRARLLLTGLSPGRQQEIAAHVRPEDPLLACFASDAAFLAADDGTRALGRAVVVFGAELGLVPVRADRRRGEAAAVPDAAAAVTLLREVLALDPADEGSRYDLALRLRGLGRNDEEFAEFATLARGAGPLASFARAMLALQAHDDAAAERALREAIATAPALGYAHFLLGQLLLRADRLDEASSELTQSAALLGQQADLPAQLQRIEARRRELAATAGN